MKWVVTNVPTWLVGVVLIVGLPALAVSLKLVIDRKARSLARGSHNDVAGFLLAIVAVVYAVIVGFTIVSLYEASVTANQDVSTEAAELLQLHNGNVALDASLRARVDGDVVTYAQAVVSDWKFISEGNASPAVQRPLNDIYLALSAYTPRNAAQSDYLNQSIVDVNSLSQARVTRQLEASDSSSVPLVLWIAILITSAITLAFTLVFALEDLRVASAMVAGVAAVIAVNIFVLIELGYPFLGTVSVGPGKFLAVIRIVAGGR